MAKLKTQLKDGTRIAIIQDVYCIAHDAPLDEFLTFKKFSEHAFCYIKSGTILTYSAELDMFIGDECEAFASKQCKFFLGKRFYCIVPERVSVKSNIHPDSNTFVIGYKDDWPIVGKIVYYNGSHFFYDNEKIKLTHWSFYDPDEPIPDMVVLK